MEKSQDRLTLEGMTDHELQTEAIRHEVSVSLPRNLCIDMIESLLRRNDPPRLDLMESAEAPLPAQSSTVTDTIRIAPNTQVNASSSNDQLLPSTEGSLMQICSLMLEQSRQQQALMQQMFAAMNINNPLCSTPAVAHKPQAFLAGPSLQEQRLSLQEQRPSLQD